MFYKLRLFYRRSASCRVDLQQQTTVSPNLLYARGGGFEISYELLNWTCLFLFLFTTRNLSSTLRYGMRKTNSKFSRTSVYFAKLKILSKIGYFLGLLEVINKRLDFNLITAFKCFLRTISINTL